MRRAGGETMVTHGSPMILLELLTEQADKHNDGDQPKLQRCCDHAQSYEINELAANHVRSYEINEFIVNHVKSFGMNDFM